MDRYPDAKRDDEDDQNSPVDNEKPVLTVEELISKMKKSSSQNSPSFLDQSMNREFEGGSSSKSKSSDGIETTTSTKEKLYRGTFDLAPNANDLMNNIRNTIISPFFPKPPEGTNVTPMYEITNSLSLHSDGGIKNAIQQIIDNSLDLRENNRLEDQLRRILNNSVGNDVRELISRIKDLISWLIFFLIVLIVLILCAIFSVVCQIFGHVY